MINSILRQIKIDLITDTPNPIIEWFNDLCSRIFVLETDVYHTNGGEFIYYIILEDKKKFIFLRDDINDRFWCSNSHYWSILENEFHIKYGDIQDITKLLVDNALNNGVSTSSSWSSFAGGSVDNALNNGVSTSPALLHLPDSIVDNALNNGVSTSLSPERITEFTVDNALNNDVATPIILYDKHTKVDNALNNK